MLWLNPDSGWRITEVNECRYKPDKNGGRPAYCDVSDTTVRFASGSGCIGCCACEDSGQVWINVTVERRAEKPYIEWVKVDPDAPEILEDYTILVSVRNPLDESATVTLWCNETGLLEGYDDQLLIPPANKSQTLTIPPNSNATFSFKYKHYWRWMKPLEVLSGAEGGEGIIKDILEQIPEDELPEILTKTTKVLNIIEYAAMLGAKPIAIYKYEISSPEILKLEEKDTAVFVHKVKILSLVTSVVESGLAGRFTAGAVVSAVVPELGWSVAAVLSVGEGLSIFFSDLFMKASVDPIPDYTKPVVLLLMAIPELEECPDNPVKDMVKQYTLLASEAKAFKEAWAKYIGAKMANDIEWERRQLITAYYYLNLLLNDYTVLKEKTKTSMAYLQSMGLNITEEDVEYVKQNLTEKGLPKLEVDLLKRFGFNDEEINATKDIVLMLPNEILIRYNETILNDMNVQQTLLSWVADNLTREINEVGFINASIDIHPETINLKSKGKWITAWIEMPDYYVSKINISSVYLNGVVQAENNPKYGFVRNPKIKDRDGDGYPELMVKFNREEVKKILRVGNVTLFLIGEIDGKHFIGKKEVKVI